MSDPLWTQVAPAERNILDPYLASIPVRIGAIAQHLGLDVARSPLEPRISGLIRPSATAQAGFEIKVNKYEINERQRFTLAHEIGHYLLHRASIGTGVVDNTLYRSALTSRKEAEANRLAADIIMPMAQVRERLRARGGIATVEIAEALAEEFEVSVPAMKIRLGLEP